MASRCPMPLTYSEAGVGHNLDFLLHLGSRFLAQLDVLIFGKQIPTRFDGLWLGQRP
jgi:hypothetical protein